MSNFVQIEVVHLGFDRLHLHAAVLSRQPGDSKSPSPIDAVRPEVRSATISGEHVGTGKASFSDTIPHSEKVPKDSSATQSPTFSPTGKEAFRHP